LIDTAEGLADYESLLSSVLKSEKCVISAVLLTHWHHDHVGGIDQVTALCPKATFSKNYPSDSKLEYLPINDGDEFSVEGATVKAVHTPGHTADHTAFYMETSGGLFTGDSVLGQGTTVFENLTTYLSSLKKQLDLNPATIFPGHGPVITGRQAARDKIQEYINHREQRENEIIDVIMKRGSDAQVTAEDVVKVIYAKYPQSLWPAAERGVLQHLDKLKDEGRAQNVGGGKWVLTSSKSSL
jgi:ribonuclease/clavin/mitogillin